MRVIMFVAFFLVLVTPVFAGVWDAREFKISEGSTESVGSYLVRIDEVDDSSKSAYVTITRNGVRVAADILTPKKPLIVGEQIRVDLTGFSNLYSYGKIVRLNISPWVDARIASYRIPTIVSWTSNMNYQGYVFIENTGTIETPFRVELVQEGTYDSGTDDYVINGEHVTKVLDVQKPIMYEIVSPGVTEKVMYTSLKATTRQHSGHLAKDMAATSRYIFRVSYKDKVLDEVFTEKVEKTTTQTGYIQDIQIPLIMYANSKYESLAIMTNGGQAFGNGEKAKFNLELRTPGFELQSTNENLGGKMGGSDPVVSIYPDMLRGYLFAYSTQKWRFNIMPHVPEGTYNLLFILTRKGSSPSTNVELDRIVIPVQVRKGYSVKIDTVQIPDAEFGHYVPVKVSLKNYGVGTTVKLKLTSSMMEEAQEKVIQIPGFMTMDTEFFVTALGSGKTPISLKLTTYGVNLGKNMDPSGGGNFLLDEKTVNMMIQTPEDVQAKDGKLKNNEPKSSLPKNVVVTPLPDVVIPVAGDPPIVEPTPILLPETETVKDEKFSLPDSPPLPSFPTTQIDILPFVFLAAAVIIFLLGLRMVWSSRSNNKEPEPLEQEVVRIEMPELVSRPVKKKVTKRVR